MADPLATEAPRVTASAWAPLALPVYRMLWATWLTANLCMWMNDVAAAWLMTTLTTSPVMIALVQSASMLPVFLLGLPSGALADIIDRRRYYLFTQFWLAGVALVMGVVAFAGAMTASMLLTLTFANGIGLAMRWPVFAAILPELVPRLQLPSALALSGVAMNASRIFGPLIAGLILASAGAAYVFVLNAVLSLGAAWVIWRWKRESKPSALPGERFVGAIRVGWQYVRQSSRMHVTMARVAFFFLQSTALMALLPLVALGLSPDGGAGTFSWLLACMGMGAIAAVSQMPKVRDRWTRDQLIRGGTVLQAVAMAVAAVAPNLYVATPAMFAAGMAWLTVANSLTVTAQMALPDWVRARGMSIYQMALMGSAGVSAALWGQVASFTSVRTSLLAAALTGLVVLVLAWRLRVDDTEQEDLTPSMVSYPDVAVPVEPDAGPVLVMVAYQIDPGRLDEFLAVMDESRRSRLRRGALAWELFRDTADPNRYIEYFVDETWVEHLRRFDRASAYDMALRERRVALHVGPEPPHVTRCVATPPRAR